MKKLSNKNPYSIPKNRQLELKYYCLQYKDWLRRIKELNLYLDGDDPTGDIAVELSYLNRQVLTVKDCCALVGDKDDILLDAVTNGRSYDMLEARRGTLPWSRRAYYKMFRRFMYILHSRKMELF